jgi:hypothetical protein
MQSSDDSAYLFRRAEEEAKKASLARRRGDPPEVVAIHEELATRYHMKALALVINSRDRPANDSGKQPAGANASSC